MSDDNDRFDPYRYGQPPIAQPVTPSKPTGKQILGAAWRLLKQDKQLLALPVMGTVFGLVAFAVLFLPGLAFAIGSHHDSRGWIYLIALPGAFLASIISIYFQAALVVGVYQRADGGDPTVGSALAGAWTLRRQILEWAVLTTVVGTIIRAVEQRLGVAGKILGFLGGIAWAIASFFVVPIIVAEGLGPIDALKRSAATIKQMWGTSVRTTLRFGVIQLALTIVPMLVLVLGVALIGSSGTAGAAGGVGLMLLGGLALVALGIVFGAISTYARGLIYRWATGRPVPGVDPASFAGVFEPKSRRARRRG